MKNNKIHSIKLLIEKFWDLENELDLLNYEINGVKIWLYLRFRIYLSLARKLGMYENAHTKKVKFLDLLKATPSLLYYSFFSNPLGGLYNKDFLIFNSGRKVNVDGNNIDIYSEYFLEELEGESYEIIEELYLNKHLSKDKTNRKHQDFQQVRTFIKSKLSRFNFNDIDLQFISEIENEIKLKIGVDFSLKKLMLKGYKNFKYDFEFYDQLIKKRNPKKIYLVCSYGYKMALIAAAKKNNVETIEFQHGTMDKHNMGYSYPNNSVIEYFPDKIYFFGNYWKECMQFPLKEENKIVKGFAYFRKRKEQYKGIKKGKSKILIISQGTIGKKLSNFIWKCKDDLENYNITYKLHPGEFERWKTDYPELVKLSGQKNVTVIDDNKKDLYLYMALSELVIGVYSTALYEALAFGCKVILVDLPGIEQMEDLIEKDFVKLAKTSEDLKRYIEENDFKQFNSDLFFAT